MNTNLLEFLLNIYILFAIFILFNNLSLILCQKSKSNGKPSPKQSQSRTQIEAPPGVDPSDTTISRALPAHAEGGGDWHYGENWSGMGDCGGFAQSPIRLTTSGAVQNRSLHMVFGNYKRLIRAAYIENNGHTVQLGFSDRFKLSLYGTATNYRKFIFQQLHFHWGSYDKVGSEHTVDGYRAPMELHLVHYNAKYGSFDNALDKSDGLMVLGVLFRKSSRKNPVFSSVIKSVSKIPNYDDKAYIRPSFKMSQLLPTIKRPFFMYSGSLTTPPCYESVQWFVFKRPVLIGYIQENQFRKIRGEVINAKTGKKRLIANNFRPVQAINERQIIIST